LEGIQQLLDLETDNLTGLISITELLKERKFYEAKGSLISLIKSVDLLEKHIILYLNQSINEFYDSEATLSYERRDMDDKKEKILIWLNDVKHDINEIVEYIEGKFDSQKIMDLHTALHKTLIQNNSLTDFTNSARIIMVEYELHRNKMLFQQDNNNYLYQSLKLDKKIKKASEKLFKEGNYNEAILNSCIMIENLVQKKSKKQDFHGTDLMAKVFNVEKPILKVNDLSTKIKMGEQRGVMLLLMGAFSVLRNPRAHIFGKKIEPVTALSILGFLNILVEYIDSSSFEDR